MATSAISLSSQPSFEAKRLRGGFLLDPDVMLPGHATPILTSGFSDSLLAERGLERGEVDSQLESYQATIFPA